MKRQQMPSVFADYYRDYGLFGLLCCVTNIVKGSIVKNIITLKNRLLIGLTLIFATHTHAMAGELPIVPNVQLEGDQLTWDALDVATGYNIHIDSRYLTTVFDIFEYTVTEVGTYTVLGFNDEGDFTPIRGSELLFFAEGVDNRTLVNQFTENFFYSTRRCTDVSAGESCLASCPDSIGSSNPSQSILIRGATGGACSSSDNLPINSSISPGGYTCTVSSFTSTVTAQVVCSSEIIPRN